MRIRPGLAIVVGLLGCHARESAPKTLDDHPGLSPALARATALVRTPFGFRAKPSANWTNTGAFDVTLPDRADGLTRISVGKDTFLTVKPLDVPPSELRIDAKKLVARVAPATDLVHILEPARVEELRILHDSSASPVLRERIELGPGLTTLRLHEGRIEALDVRDNVRIASEPLVATDANGAKRALNVTLDADANGATLTATLDTAGLAHPIAIDPAWTPTASTMITGHYVTRTFRFSNGKVMVIGGRDYKPDLYDPTIGYWFAGGTTAAYHGYDNYARMEAVQLPSGKVLLAGGDASGVPHSVAEIYDPATNAWTTVASMLGKRYRHGLVLLQSGKVFAAGGTDGATGLSTSEIYDPAADTWTAGPSSLVGHESAGIIALANGKVLMAGGANNAAGTTSVAEVYDPTAGTWSLTSSMPTPRRGMRTVLLPSGKVLLFGGSASYPTMDNYAQLYDPATGTFTPSSLPGGPMHQGAGHVFLGSGKLLVMALPQNGGTFPYNSLYDPATDSWAQTASFPGSNLGAAWPVLMPDGTALAAEGAGDPVAAIFNEGFAVAGACAKDADCASSHCVDGVCCNTACNAQCQACNEPGAAGTCTTITGKPRGSRTACSGTGACGATCDGVASTCVFPGASTTCIAASCTGGTSTPASSCDGAGNCPANPTVSCALYVCGAVSCKTACVADTDCAAGAYCDTGKCVAKKSAGGACTGDSACKPGADGNGHCTGGVCCDRACDGVCEACDSSGSVGVCAARASTVSCGTAGCTGGTLTTAGHCSGTDGTCVVGSSSACAGHFACADATTCKTSCTTGADCVAGYDCVAGACVMSADAGADTGTPDTGTPDTGMVTDTGMPETEAPDSTTADAASTEDTAPDPEKVPRVSGTFTTCHQASDCATGNCVDGVCCDSPCTDKCKTCSSPSAPGKCVFEPFGVDSKHECGPDLSCISTCDGKGACTGAGPGTMCGRNVCTGQTTGIGPAYCTGKGDACPKDDVFPFDCAPYICEPPFGACRTTCSSSDQCGPGYVCDTTSARCINAGPPEDSSGCAMSTSRSTSFASLLVLLGLLRTARRRVARRPTAL